MNLTKRPDGLPKINFYCAVCDGPIDGYTVTDIDNPPHIMAFNAYCHGDTIRWGIEDVEGFWESMAIYRGEHADPMVLFGKQPQPERRDSTDPVDGTEM